MAQIRRLFGLRELLKDRVEYVQVDTPLRIGFSKRKGALDDYLKRIQPIEHEIQRVEDGRSPVKEVTEVGDALRKKLGMTENISLKRAQDELALPPLTDQRLSELRLYVEQVDQADSELKKTYNDTQYAKEIQALESEFSKVMAEVGIGEIAEYVPVLNAYLARKDLDAKEAKVRGELSKLHQKFVDAGKRKTHRFAIARDAAIASIALPAGVVDFRSAMRELNADRSPERRERLKNYVIDLQRLEEEARVRVIGGLTERIHREPRPDGVDSPDEVRAEISQLNEILAMTYAPEGYPQIAAAAASVRKLEAQMIFLMNGDTDVLGLEKLLLKAQEARAKRTKAVKAFENLWSKGVITSAAISEKEEKVQELLAKYKEMYLSFHEQERAFLEQLKESGTLTEENVTVSTPDLISLRDKVIKLKATFFAQRAALENLRWKESLTGDLTGPESAVKEVKELAEKIYGKKYVSSGQPEVDSLTAIMRDAEEAYESRYADHSVVTQLYDEARIEYARLMTAAGFEVPYQIYRVDIAKALDQPLDDLLAELANDPVLVQAFRQVAGLWDTFQARLRSESHQKVDNGGVF